MRTEKWCGHSIRFIEYEGEWLAILKDVCDALDLRTDKVVERLEPSTMFKMPIPTSYHPSKGVRSRGQNRARMMVVVNELGIYEALFASRRPEARKFRMWTTTVLQRLRKRVGLEGYEVLRMTEESIQDDIDHILDTLYWDEEQKCVMQSITVQGGDVEQVPFED